MQIGDVVIHILSKKHWDSLNPFIENGGVMNTR